MDSGHQAAGNSSIKQELPKFIEKIESGYADVRRSYLNNIFKNKDHIYNVVIKKGFYLPDIKSRAVNCKYLLQVLEGKVFSIKCDNVKPFLIEVIKISKLDLIAYLHEVALKNVDLGFDLQHLPDRKWMLDVLHTVDSTHYAFTGKRKLDKIISVPVS